MIRRTPDKKGLVVPSRVMGQVGAGGVSSTETPVHLEDHSTHLLARDILPLNLDQKTRTTHKAYFGNACKPTKPTVPSSLRLPLSGFCHPKMQLALSVARESKSLARTDMLVGLWVCRHFPVGIGSLVLPTPIVAKLKAGGASAQSGASNRQQRPLLVRRAGAPLLTEPPAHNLPGQALDASGRAGLTFHPLANFDALTSQLC